MDDRTGRDRVLEGFLEAQYEQGMALAGESDLLDLAPQGPPPHRAYLARFSCTGLVRGPDGGVIEASEFHVAILFPPHYLRRAHTAETLFWAGPSSAFHPNIDPARQLVCIGDLWPGTGIAEILFRTFALITYKKLTTVESDALNYEACAWARRNMHRFPVDPRPLKRRKLGLRVSL